MPVVNGTWLPYNMPNITSFYGMFQYANSVTGDLFGSLMIFAVFIIAFISTKQRQPPEQSVAFAGYISTILSILMRILLLVPDALVVGMILITSFATLLLVRRELWE